MVIIFQQLSQEELTNFIQRRDRFYQVVKLEGPIYIKDMVA